MSDQLKSYGSRDDRDARVLHENAYKTESNRSHQSYFSNGDIIPFSLSGYSTNRSSGNARVTKFYPTSV